MMFLDGRKCGALLLGLWATIGVARAGEVTGRISLADPDASGAVVWVEDLKGGAVPAEKPLLSQKDVQFSPSLLVVVVGQTVVMPNNDSIAHNVFSRSPAKTFNLGIYPKGQSKSVVFDKPGVVELFCSIHRNMNAKILVVPNAHFTEVKPGDHDRYKLSGLPAGKHVLKAWGPDREEQSKTIVVPESGAVTVDFTFPKRE